MKMKRITSKQVISMMEAVAQVYEQPEVEQLDEVSLNPMSSADVRAKAIERMKAQGMTQAQIDKALAAMDKSAEEKAADAKTAREKRDRQAPGGLGTDGRSGALGQLIRTIQKTGVTGDEGAQAARDYDAAAKILLKDPKNRGPRGELTASTEDIRSEIQRIRDARFAKKPDDAPETSKTNEPSATQQQVNKDKEQYGDTVPQGSFNVSPQGTDRRKEVEDQIKRDNAARAQNPDPAPKTDQTPAPSSNQTSPQSNPFGTPFGTRKRRQRSGFGSGSTPGVSRRGVTNSYEYVIGKLIAEGHASSVAEAEYVYKQLDEDYIESMLLEQNLSYSDATAILKNHQYDKAQLMKMSRKATETGQHGLAQACYDAACKMKI